MAGFLLPDTGASRKRPPLAVTAAPILRDVSASTASRGALRRALSAARCLGRFAAACAVRALRRPRVACAVAPLGAARRAGRGRARGAGVTPARAPRAAPQRRTGAHVDVALAGGDALQHAARAEDDRLSGGGV